MFQEKNRENWPVYVLFVGAMAAVAFMILLSAGRQFDAKIDRFISGVDAENFSFGWTLIQEGKEELISMPYRTEAGPSEVIELRHKLPKQLPSSVAVCFHTEFSSVEVEAGGILLYRYTHSGKYPFGRTAPGRWNLVRIPQSAQGQDLVLRISSPYAGFSGKLMPVWMGDPLNLFLYLMNKYVPQFIVCGVFFVFGIAVIGASVLLRNQLADICTLRCFGIFVCLSSVWMMSEIEFTVLALDGSYVLPTIRYTMVMLCPIAYLLYLMHHFPAEYGRYLRGLCYLFILNLFITLFLQLTGIAEFAEMIWTTHFCLLMMFLVLVAVIGIRIVKERPIKQHFILECTGISVLAGSLAGEMWLYYQREYMKSGDFFRAGLFVYIICLFIILLMEIKEQKEAAREMGRELQNSRLRLMISQIQPHFIYNTLSSVRTLIKLEPDKAYELVYNFSKYLRANIDSIGQDGMIPFSREMEHIRNYFSIEKMRFGEKLSMVCRIEEYDFQVPPLTVQPLVENAIKHGIRGKTGRGTVTIHSYKEKDSYVIEVIDDGAGFDTGAEKSKDSAGLDNISLRLKEIASGRLEISSTPGSGTRAVIILPEKKNQGGGR